MDLIGTFMVKHISRQRQWKDTLADAAYALARLDAEELEDMALSCAALIRDGEERHIESRRQGETIREAERQFALFARLLDATKVNLKVIRRVRTVHAAQPDDGPARRYCAYSTDGLHGDH